jgi:small subunit ribosomal protein S6
MIYILRPDIDDAGNQELQDRLQQTITSQQGETLSIDRWGKRNLAYQIKRYGQGIYMLHRFQMNPAGAAEIERLMRLNENVIRYLITRNEA